MLDDGWPTLGQRRGKVIFLMDNGDPYRNRYLAGHPSLRGPRPVHELRAGPARRRLPEAQRPDATRRIQDLVEQGYVVRTRSDADTVEARTDDTTVRGAALRSGAQWVSTDYPVPTTAAVFATPYHVEIPGAPSPGATRSTRRAAA